jgi:hypothetical protein
MGALERRLEEIEDTFDIATLFDSDVSTIESTTYTRPTIYKYFSAERRYFFSKPQVRISQKDVLNDPFESTVRWRSVGLGVLRDYVSARISHVLPILLSDTEYLIERVNEEFAENGITLNPQQRAFIEERLRSQEGKADIANELPKIQFSSQMIVARVFSQLTIEFDKIIENSLLRSGVLSLTEQPFNKEMWMRYGGNGGGFVVGFDAQHPFFFRARDGTWTNALRKVIYSDQWPETFVRNPYYMFLVKSPGWAGEQEWRIFLEFDKCDESLGTGPTTVHLANLPPEIIRSVHFGTAYRPQDIEKDIARLKAFGCTPEFYRIELGDLVDRAKR